jgi:hypothetical protein
VHTLPIWFWSTLQPCRVIVDGEGKQEEVRGPGCVGQQPVLVPGNSFEYQRCVKCCQRYLNLSSTCLYAALLHLYRDKDWL